MPPPQRRTAMTVTAISSCSLLLQSHPRSCLFWGFLVANAALFLLVQLGHEYDWFSFLHQDTNEWYRPENGSPSLLLLSNSLDTAITSARNTADDPETATTTCNQDCV
eukprot:CAMPEP_0172468122 /NCGR_PEP_ID=MMETSP1065-20121228/60729_1 /TAXON_ID=265537 /ORGANISM="Amphiprora paludosa, Strain CCMP125" /LENGTH=107 /DNA_ID=CAMNT_0013225457 /DNA_START=7 /DNA_END=327 /DNA_ORIENTATION=-